MLDIILYDFFHYYLIILIKIWHCSIYSEISLSVHYLEERSFSSPSNIHLVSFHTQLQKLGLCTYKWIYLSVCMYRQEEMLFFVACMKIQVRLDQLNQEQKITFPGICSLMWEAFKSLHEKLHKQFQEVHIECIRNKC